MHLRWIGGTGHYAWCRLSDKERFARVHYASMELSHHRSTIFIKVEAIYTVSRDCDKGTTIPIVVASYEVRDRENSWRLNIDPGKLEDFPWDRVPIAKTSLSQGKKSKGVLPVLKPYKLIPCQTCRKLFRDTVSDKHHGRCLSQVLAQVTSLSLLIYPALHHSPPIVQAAISPQ